ncbi:ribonuclease H2 subunit B isoform X3 [Periophthalmus magnuspinnatus]|uniref:ribonuclease H2 subunit B isoform X3 n=1 Tax=Periophthalmus magnuspinnatus TaxID=409849 RepID=UPI002436F6EB|nr:ribonuclease H2 subunit B isoform X3 [Periophthalmus magnuspinnatus]
MRMRLYKRSLKCPQRGTGLSLQHPESSAEVGQLRAPMADSAVDPKRRDADPCFVKLKNPRTDTASLYMFGSGDTQLYEVKAFEEDFHSWFIGQTVQHDGRLLFITPLDPLYLLLPYLLHAGKEEKFQPLDQLLVDENFPACSRLLSCPCSVQHLAEEKEVGSRKFYRYSQERTLDWLKKKVDRTVVALKKKNISVGEGVKSATYIKVKTESNCREEDYLRYAHGLISEYLSEDLSNALLKHLNLPELTSPKESEPPSKPPKKMTAAQKTLAKVDKSGMKTMSSFFSPKVKK